ncbi:MAG: ABC transporter permease [Bacilli bacterium]|nr:ABC transporter permease [Bacilli bacterium]
MNKLVKNELYKIFHKKGIYILFIVFASIYLLSGILTKISTNGVMDNLVISVARENLDVYDKDNPEQAAAYVELKIEVDKYDLVSELNPNYTSPEYYYIMNEMTPYYREAYTDKYVKKDEEAAAISQKKLNEAIEKARHYDWKELVNKNIEETKANELLSESTKNEILRVLQYRLDNNIPYTYKGGSQDLEEYVGQLAEYELMSKDDNAYITYEAKLQKRNVESKMAILKYKIDNKLITDMDDTSGTAQQSFINIFGNVSIFLIVCILMIAGSILSDEFNKGTIKQLLTRPYCRSKIFISKFIASFITTVGFVIACAVVACLLTGIFTGTFGTLADPVLFYNFNTQSVVSLNTITASLLSFAAILPEILILILFAMLISATICNTTVAVVLGFVLSFSAELFVMFINKVKLLSYFPVFNWDLTPYLFGGLNDIQALTFTKAIIVDVVTVIVLFVASLIIFKKKDVKNQ